MKRELLHRIRVRDLEGLGIYNGDGAVDDVRHVDPLRQVGKRLLDLRGHRRGVDVDRLLFLGRRLGSRFLLLFGRLLLFLYHRLLGDGGLLFFDGLGGRPSNPGEQLVARGGVGQEEERPEHPREE